MQMNIQVFTYYINGYSVRKNIIKSYTEPLSVNVLTDILSTEL